MVQTERVPDLLTHHVQFLIRVVVRGRVEVGVIHFGRTLGYVSTASDIDGRQTKPSVIAVCPVADLNRSSDHLAVSSRSASNGG